MTKSVTGMKIRRKGGTFGIIMGIMLMLSAVIPLLELSTSPESSTLALYVPRITLTALFAAGAVLFLRGKRKRSLFIRLEHIRDLMLRYGNRVPFQTATDLLTCDLTTLVRDVRDMSRFKLVQGLYADLLRKDLVYIGGNETDTVDPPVPEGDVVILREEYKPSAAAFYAFAFAWAFCAFLFPLYRTIDFVLVAAISVIVYVIVSKRIQPRLFITELQPEKPKQTGNEALDEMLTNADIHIKTLHKLRKNTSGKLSQPVMDLCTTTEQIVMQLRKKPENAANVRQFFNYTLPTTINLLQNYEELLKQPVKGKNITEAIDKIEGMMGSINDAFRQQLDALFQDTALDITVQLDVMKSMLGQDDF